MSGIPIFIASDDNYAPFIATAIASICDNTKSFCEFYVLDSGISITNQEKICELKSRFNNFSVEFLKIDLEKDLNSIEYKNPFVHSTISTYNRFLISKLKPNLGKVIYLDSDIIVMGDIEELFCIQLGNYLLGAISELNTNPKNAKQRCLALNLDCNHAYFNAGVLLLDTQKWAQENIAQKLFETEKLYRTKLQWADQDVFNILFNNNYLRLPEKFNYLTSEQKIDNELIIRHFDTNIKPWHFHPNLSSTLIKNCEDFWKYMKMTKFYYETLDKCIYRTQEDLLKLRFQIIMRKRHFAK